MKIRIRIVSKRVWCIRVSRGDEAEAEGELMRSDWDLPLEDAIEGMGTSGLRFGVDRFEV